jgi:hypothetical protein
MNATEELPEVGERVTPIPAWNQTTGYEGARLTESVTVLAVRPHAVGGSGCLLKVRSIDGRLLWIDARWFVEFQGRRWNP